MKTKFILYIIVIFAVFLFNSQKALYAITENKELAEYFELRDTIILMNDEMKKVINGEKEQSIFNDSDPIQNLNGSMTFIEKRMDEFNSKKYKLKDYYTKNLKKIFAEAVNLHMQAKAIYIQEAQNKANESFEAKVNAMVLANLEKEYSDSVDSWKRPYFEPIDVRLLAAEKRISTSEDDKEKSNSSESNKTLENLKPTKENAKEILDKLNKKLDDLEKKREIPPLLPPKKTTKEEEKEKREENKTVTKDIIVPEQQNKNVIHSIKPPVSVTATKTPSVEEIKPKTEIKPALKEKSDNSPKAVPTGIIKGEIKSPIRPMAIMIENHKAARPQTGLNEADIVYEIPVEGGITRFMCIYIKIPNIVGPVRSCREYFVDRALEANAVYIHCGGSPKGYDYISSSKIYSIDEIQYGKPFYRDNSRKAPHNLYSKGRKLFDAACTLYPMTMDKTPNFIHRGKNKDISSEKALSVSIKYHGDYSVDIKYDKGVYNRYMNGILHIDKETTKALEAKTVIVQTANMKVVDKVGRQEISFIGSGDAFILEDGKITKVTWHKESPNSVTVYKYKNGKEYLFPEKGQIWVQVISPTHKITISDKE